MAVMEDLAFFGCPLADVSVGGSGRKVWRVAAAHAGGREEEEGSDARGELKSQKDVAGVAVWLGWSEWNHMSSHGKWEA